MLNSPYGARRAWICARCVSRRIAVPPPRPLQFPKWSSRRCQSTAASAAQPVDHAASSRHDDAVLRELFDAPSPSRARASLAALSRARKSQGLFKNRYLTSPAGFLVFARRNLAKATVLVSRVLSASTMDEYRGLVRHLDRLSDLLCRVLDLSDFVRMNHPDPAFQRAAAEAWSMVYQYMNQLNTTSGLDDQLARAMSMPEVTAGWSEEEASVAELLKLDFTKSAVNLPKHERDRFVDLSSRISDVGSAFVRQMEPSRREVTLPSHRFYGLDPELAGSLTVRSHIRVASTGPEATAAMRTVYDENTRCEIYLAQRTASPRTIALLETMLRLRAELASLAGFESYGHMALQGRMMARSPDAVGEFLDALAAHNAPAVRRELRHLTQLKRQRLGKDDARLEAWDREFYMEATRAEMLAGRKGPSSPPSRRGDMDAAGNQLADYFSVGTVMQGLSRLFDRLYGVRFVPREVLPGETWHPDVKRLDVVSDSGEQLAVLYCDLFYRPQKSSNPAHFTVRCSREILADEVADAAADMASHTNSADGIGGHGGGIAMPTFDSPEQAANDGMETSTTTTHNGGHSHSLMQLPTIALVCDFPKNDNAREPALLAFSSVETLFHEMGHAIHSVLARTRFQNVSGTRCATDFAELPSTLMEHFAADPAVLGLFARHWRTDEALPAQGVAERIRLARRFEGCDTEHQILLAMLDQAYHGPLATLASSSSSSSSAAAGTTSTGASSSSSTTTGTAASRTADKGNGGGTINSTALFHAIQSRAASSPTSPRDPPSTSWQGFFGHLFGYGSTYYSYLFDRVLAERVWRVVFNSGGSAVSASSQQGSGSGSGSGLSSSSATLDRNAGERLCQNLLRWGGGRDPWRCLADTLGDERLAAGDARSMALVGSWGIKGDKVAR